MPELEEECPRPCEGEGPPDADGHSAEPHLPLEEQSRKGVQAGHWVGASPLRADEVQPSHRLMMPRQLVEVARSCAEWRLSQVKELVVRFCEGLAGPTSPDEVGRTFVQSEQQQPQDEVTQAEEQLAPRVRAEQRQLEQR